MTKHVTRVVLLRCRDANSWMKTGNGQVSRLCQITRNEQSGSLELIISAQVRIAQVSYSNAEAKNCIELEYSSMGSAVPALVEAV